MRNSIYIKALSIALLFLGVIGLFFTDLHQSSQKADIIQTGVFTQYDRICSGFVAIEGDYCISGNSLNSNLCECSNGETGGSISRRDVTSPEGPITTETLASCSVWESTYQCSYDSDAVTPSPTATAESTPPSTTGSASCTGPDGSTIFSGSSQVYYSAQTGANCSGLSQDRTCSNGVLSGSNTFQYVSCSVAITPTPDPTPTPEPTNDPCVGPDGASILHDESRTYYSASSAIDCNAVSEQRTCGDGTLSGIYTIASCTDLTDTDGDGIPNETDTDDDGDGIADSSDQFPLDPTRSIDTDGDGIDDSEDTDDDGDGYSDTEEITAGTDPLDPSSFPNQVASYALCKVWKDEGTQTIQWTAEDYIYDQTTSTVVNGVPETTTESITDTLKTGSFSCSGVGENYSEGYLSELPAVKNGELSLPAGFPTANTLSCSISVQTVGGVSSSCDFSQTLINVSTVTLNGEPNAWHFPISVQGDKRIPIIYGGSTHEIYSESTINSGVSKPTEVVLVTNKKGDENIEWSSPNSDTGVLSDYISGDLCTSISPCTGEKVRFTSFDKEGTSSILLENLTTRESVTFTVHILPSAVESFTLDNSSLHSVYPNSRVEGTAIMNLFNGLTRNATEDELVWEFSSDGGTTWQTSSEEGIISSGVFIPKIEGLFSLRAKVENNFAGPGIDKIQHKTEEMFADNTLTIEVETAPSGMVTINGETAPWHIPVSQQGIQETSLLYGGNSTFSFDGSTSTTTSDTTAETEDDTTTEETSTDTSSTSESSSCDLDGCLTVYDTKVSSETNVVLSTHIPEGENIEWSHSPSDTGVLKDFITKEICTETNPCTGEKVVFYGGEKEGTTGVLLENITNNESITYTLYTLPSATESIEISSPQSQMYANGKMDITAISQLFNGNTNTIDQEDLQWEFSMDGGTTWQMSSDDATISTGSFFPKTEGIYTLRAKIGEKNGYVGRSNIRYKDHEVYSQNMLTIEVVTPPEWHVLINGESGDWVFPVSQKGTKDVIMTYGDEETDTEGEEETEESETEEEATVESEYQPGYVYTHTVSTETGFILNTHKQGSEVLQWSSPNTETGILTDYSTGQICSIQNPCTGLQVLFTGGTKEGTSSILLKNVTSNESITYQVETLPSAIESFTLENNNTEKAYINKAIEFDAMAYLFNGEITNPSATEINWEFSTDGGTTWQTSSEEGIVSGGTIIPKIEGLFTVRAKIYEKKSDYGDTEIELSDHVIISENVIVFEAETPPSWHVLINGVSAPFHFPVAMTGGDIMTRAYGDGSEEDEEATEEESTTVEDEIIRSSVALENRIELYTHPDSTDQIEWFSPKSISGYLIDPETEVLCTEASPCTGNSAIFVGGEKEGISSVVLTNRTNDEFVTYTFHTLAPKTNSIDLETIGASEYFMYSEIFLQANDLFYNSETEVISNTESLSWFFSYDGGTTWETDSENGNISSGIFTPQKEGTVLIKTIQQEQEAMYGSEGISWNTYTVESEHLPLIIDQTKISIDQAYLLGNNIINRNTTATVMASITSREAINNLQSFSVGLFEGMVTADTYPVTSNIAYIFKEMHNDSPIKEYLEEEGGNNRGILEIPIFIPEYDENRYMKDGYYTILLELYRDDRVVSEYFIPVTLGNNFASCDINDDGYQNIIDIILSLKFLNGSLIPTSDEMERVDKNDNGLIDLQDVVMLFPCIL